MWFFISKLAILVFIVSVVVKGQVTDVRQYDLCDSIQLDRCGYMIYGLIHRPSSIPTTYQDLQEVCMTMEEGVKCLKERLAECPTIMSSKLAPGYLESLPKLISAICDNGGRELGKNLIPHGKCIRDRLEGFSCPQIFFDEVEGALYEPTVDEQLISTCCASRKYDRCSFIAYKRSCGRDAAVAKNDLTETLSGFLQKECVGVLKNRIHKCAHRIPIPLPRGHRKVSNVLAGLNDIFYNKLGP